MQATVNLATETALVRAALADEPDGHAERLEALGKELVQVSKAASSTLSWHMYTAAAAMQKQCFQQCVHQVLHHCK